MSKNDIRKTAGASVVALALLLGSVTGHAQCTYPDVHSGGIWTYIGRDDHLTITLVNLTDYLLYNSGDVHTILDWQGTQDPFNARPIKVMDLDGDGRLEAGVPPYSGATWAATTSSSYHNEYFERELILELTGFTDGKGVIHPGPTWPSKFRVWFTPQEPAKGGDKGTWIALHDEFGDENKWDAPNLYRSGVWTTPHFPGNVTYPSGGDDLQIRNIMTMANKHVVVTLYSADHLNIVIVVRQTNWVGPAIPSDADPVAGMDAYKAWRLDWAENTSDSVPGSCN